MIDGSSLYGASQAAGYTVDYSNLLRHFRSSSMLRCAQYYTTMIETEEYNPVRKLTDWLGFNGYRTYVKPAKETFDSTGRRRVHGNCLVEMASDMLDTTDFCDHFVLFSNHGDLTYPVSRLQDRGVRISVVSLARGDAGGSYCDDRLRNQADAFVDLSNADVRAVIERKHEGTDVVEPVQVTRSAEIAASVEKLRRPRSA